MKQYPGTDIWYDPREEKYKQVLQILTHNIDGELKQEMIKQICRQIIENHKGESPYRRHRACLYIKRMRAKR